MRTHLVLRSAWSFYTARCAVLAVLYGVCVSACRRDQPALSPKAEEPVLGPYRGEVVILLTHPTVQVLRNFVFLVENKIFDMPGLRLVGVYYEHALEHWSAATRFVRRTRHGWLTLRKVHCQVTEREVFRRNGCSAAFRKLLQSSRGIIFTGGPDLPPSLYGHPARLTTRVRHPARHWFEMSFLYHLVGRTPVGRTGETVHDEPGFADGVAQTEKPRLEPIRPFLREFPHYSVLAICLGMETLNVAAGGTLVQDIPSEIYGAVTAQQALAMPLHNQHACYDYLARSSVPRQDWTIHPIRWVEGRPFDRAHCGSGHCGSERHAADWVEVLTAHHQAVGVLGVGLKALAYSADGKVIEALGHTEFPNLLGVQFHPESSKAFMAQRQCARAGEREGRPRYRLSESMVKFYRQFWRSFAERFQRTDP